MSTSGAEAGVARHSTMADIARRAGVSRIAVSYALNGRPGVSDDLRARIVQIAAEMGYRPAGRAQAPQEASALAIGMVVLRPSAAFTLEVFRRELIAGVQTELASRGYGLALQFVDSLADEIAVHRRWSIEQRVDGVLVGDPRTDDPRVGALLELGLPGVLVGGDAAGAGAQAGLPRIFSDDTASTHQAVRYLVEAGHRRITRVSGPADLVHTVTRDDTFRLVCQEAGVAAAVVRADYTGEAGARATRDMLAAPDRPTAIMYDNDVMAVAGLGAAQEMGLSVPADVSLVAWEDSTLCQVVRPPLTVLKRDIVAYGYAAAQLLHAVIAGDAPASVQADTAELVIRGSSGPVRS